MSCVETDFCTSTGMPFKLHFTHLEDAGGAVVPLAGDSYKLAIRKNTSLTNDVVLDTSVAPSMGSVATLNLTTGEVDFSVSASAIALIGAGLCTYCVQYNIQGVPDDIILKGDLAIEEGLL